MTKYNLTLTLAESQTEEKICAIERSYPNVGVGQILKQYLEYFSSYVHLSKLKSSNTVILVLFQLKFHQYLLA